MSISLTELQSNAGLVLILFSSQALSYAGIRYLSTFLISQVQRIEVERSAAGGC